ncbi:dihydrodipicolinate synthetase family protein-like protein [Corynespora cassiicola Philippines]|uniref:Dihydrodipicolinate synthetase family protein-like protein n=1 Tax=Corynespora cassiicola Philippines TaxID=1448308 RepID=A0A2T2NJ76_CORCC|nr:dihydrodipicolinate synthetase family protein-like protein [Corynespora cassiicola Philippines]
MAIPKAGVWAPSVTYFDPETGKLDLESQKKFFKYLSTTGLAGLVILGTNAETFLLTREERRALIAAAREAVGPDFQLMCGVSGHSVAQVLEFIQDAVEAGADFGLLLPAAYFGAATTKEVVEGFYDEVVEKSSLPIIIYNFPAVCNGVDLDSVTIAALAKRHPGKIVGVKLTCGSVAKITRLAAELPQDSFVSYAGQADFLIGGLAVGGHGCISAFANSFPKTLSRIYELWTSGKQAEALELHRKAALAESGTKAGIASVKYAVSRYSAPAAGIDNAEQKLKPRRPYRPVGDAVKANIHGFLDELAQYEKTL